MKSIEQLIYENQELQGMHDLLYWKVSDLYHTMERFRTSRQSERIRDAIQNIKNPEPVPKPEPTEVLDTLEVIDKHYHKRIQDLEAERDGRKRALAKQEAKGQTPLEELGLTVRTHHVLTRENIFSVEQLTAKTRAEIFKFTEIGMKSLQEIVDVLASRGLKLKGSK
jgi:DNA-directed RNA polymerase alpha subunit